MTNPPFRKTAMANAVQTLIYGIGRPGALAKYLLECSTVYSNARKGG